VTGKTIGTVGPALLLVPLAMIATLSCQGPQGPDGSDAVVVDSLPPQVVWIRPDPGAVADTTLLLEVSARDETELWRVVFSATGFDYPPDSSRGDRYYFTWTCRYYPAGSYPLVVRVWDASRNSSITPVRMVEVRH